MTWETLGKGWDWRPLQSPSQTPLAYRTVRLGGFGAPGGRGGSESSHLHIYLTTRNSTTPYSIYVGKSHPHPHPHIICMYLCSHT